MPPLAISHVQRHLSFQVEQYPKLLNVEAFSHTKSTKNQTDCERLRGLQTYLEESLVVQHKPPLCPGVMGGQGAACGGREEETGLEEGEGELCTDGVVAQINEFVLTGIPSPACLPSVWQAREELTKS